MSEINFQEVAARALRDAKNLIPSLLPGGRWEGNEWVCAGYQGGKGKSCKVNFRNGKSSDFATGESAGDLIGLVAIVKNCTQLEAARWLSGDSGGFSTPPRKTSTAQDKSQVDWKPIYPVPAEQCVDFDAVTHWKFGKPSRYWIYPTADGQVINVVYRFDLPDGSKQICPYTYGTLKGVTGWHWKQIPENRPLYGLDRLKEGKPVLIVEGEKAADAAYELLRGAPVITWSGGAQAWKKADLSPLKGRPVTLVADADEPGKKAMEKVAGEALYPICEKVHIVTPEPVDGIKGWDAADAQEAGWTGRQYFEFLKEHARKYEPTQEQSAPPPDAYNDAPPESREPDYDRPAVDKEFRISALGYDHGLFYYFSPEEEQVIAWTPSEHTPKNLHQLAPSAYWEAMYPTKRGVDYHAAATDLMHQCHVKGVYDTMKLRASGAWIDEGRVVFHTGDMLNVDGVPMQLSEFESKYTYERGQHVDYDFSAPPLKSSECQNIVEICDAVRWENPLMAHYLAGWCVVAPFCGALEWRPHLWLSGSAGAGKSYIMEKIVNPLLGEFSLHTLHSTTEAGLRGQLKLNAKPVIFDEFKGEDKGDVEKVQNVLSLVRQASSETSARIYKGSANGKSVMYSIRSCFLLSSISVALKQHADETRISVLTLRTPASDSESRRLEKENFKRIERLVLDLTPEYVQRLHNRTLRNIKTIRKNAKVFALAAADVLGTQRAGDQIGILLSGSYSLHSSSEITYEKAYEWLSSHNLDLVTDGSDPDHIRCFNTLMQTMVRTPARNGSVDITIGELVDIARTNQEWSDEEGVEVTQRAAERILSRRGLKLLNGNELAIANNHKVLSDIYRSTPWPVSWGKTLRQNPDVGNNNNQPVSFSGSVSSKVSVVPLRVLEHNAYMQPENPEDDVPF